MRSDEFLEGSTNSLGRSLMKSMGYTNDEISKPKIGIANSFSTIVPGSYNLREIAEKVTNGIYAGGGTAIEFGTIGACDGIGQGNEGMKYILPSREIIANSVEIMVQAHRLDGIVLLGSCDKIVPAMLMAAARLKIPAIFLGGGAMLGGAIFDNRKSDVNSNVEGLGMLTVGKTTQKELDILEETCCPTCGSCSFLGTANSMNCIAEALGMSLTGAALVPAVHNDRRRLAYDSGKIIVELVKKRISADKIITKESILNAIKVCIAIGGSTNVVMHLIAIAYEAGIDLDVLSEFDKLSREIPFIAKVNPASKYNIEDFWMAGGIPRVMTNLKKVLDTNVMTVSSKTLQENLDSYVYKYPNNDEVIKTMENPFSQSGAVAVMRGNLCPNTGISKPGAISKEVQHFKGKAMVFDCEEDANKAILSGKVQSGHVVVIRYEGPKGGPIAIVRDGDEIEIDIEKREVNLLVSKEEIDKRLKEWKAPALKYTKGYLSIYSKLARSGSEGAILKV